MAEYRPPVKKALCIGIEYIKLSALYPNTDFRLRGTYKDTVAFAQLLENVFGYQAQDIKVLTDDVENSTCQPTRENIIAAMIDLVKDARAGDHLLFLYAGHGSQVSAPPEHHEQSGFDEAIWPADVKFIGDEYGPTENHIIDDELHHYLLESLPPGVHMVIVFDCCHSGTAADLEFNHGTSPFTSPVECPCPQRPCGITSMPHKALGFVDNANNVDILHKPSQITQIDWNHDSLPYVTSWAACPDDKDTYENRAGGIFVQAFTAALKAQPHPTHAQLLKALTVWLYNHINRENLGCPKPQLGSIREIGSIWDTLFEM